MLRERGKPKQGPTYYNFIAQRNHPNPSQPSNPPTISVNPSRTDQNWLEIPQPPLIIPKSPPHLSNTMLDSGAVPIEEEIPPFGLETVEASPEPFNITNPPAHPTMEPGSCVVEEEIPPAG
jgi:hypothetical protein